MRRLLDDAADHDRREIGTERNDLLDRRGVRGEQVTQLHGGLRAVGERIQPRHGRVHSDTCSRKRTSESYSSRMSGKP